MKTAGPTLPWKDWQIVKRLGSGTYGVVYEIERTQYKERSAVKVITIPRDQEILDSDYSDGLTDETIHQKYADQKDKVEREYRLMAEMKSHPNIVRCEDIITEPLEDGIGWNIYIRMELLQPLHKYLRENALSPEKVRSLAMDVCQALSACEKKGIIHRDIKPENILLSEYGTFKLGDFGVARTLDHTTAATYAGTERYMAPEVWAHRSYNHTVDIYSLGLVMYWLLNDRRMPFLDPSRQPGALEMQTAMSRRLSGEQLPPPRDGSDALKQIVLKACAYSSRDRYQDAGEMFKALRYLLPEEDSAEDQTQEEDCTEMVFQDHTVDLFAQSAGSSEAGQKEGPRHDRVIPPVEAPVSGQMGGSVSGNDLEETIAVDPFSWQEAAPADEETEAAVPESAPQADAGSAAPPEDDQERAEDAVESLFRKQEKKADIPVTPVPPETPPSSGKGRSPLRVIPFVIGAVILLLLLLRSTVHVYAEPTCTEPAVCRFCGKTKGKALGHHYEPADCIHPEICSRCGDTKGEALGHDWSNASCTEPATCTRCGEQAGEPIGHDWAAATCTEPETCRRCGEKQGSELGHDWADATYDKPRTCKRCGLTSGQVKGYISGSELAKGKWADATTTLQDYETHPWLFDNTLKKLRKIKISLTVSEMNGNFWGSWGCYARVDGSWKQIGTVEVKELNKEYVKTYTLSPSANVDAIMFEPLYRMGNSGGWSNSLTFYEAQVD